MKYEQRVESGKGDLLSLKIFTAFHSSTPSYRAGNLYFWCDPYLEGFSDSQSGVMFGEGLATPRVTI